MTLSLKTNENCRPESHLDKVNQIGECKTTGSEGIDAFLSNPEAVKPHLQYCLNTLANELAQKDVTDLSTFKIYLGATAGMQGLDNFIF